MALITDIAGAVAASLGAGSFSQAFTVEQAFLVERELPETQTLRVSVVPSGMEISGGSRVANTHDVDIDIGIQKKITPANQETEVAALLDLAEEIGDHLRLARLPGFEAAGWVKTANLPIYSVEHLREQGLFTSVLTMTFKVIR